MLSSWRSSLYTPTMIQKVGNDYFIVDCWHHRIIYNDNLRDKISAWKTLTEDINGGHTLAYDGELYIRRRHQEHLRPLVLRGVYPKAAEERQGFSSYAIQLALPGKYLRAFFQHHRRAYVYRHRFGKNFHGRIS